MSLPRLLTDAHHSQPRWYHPALLRASNHDIAVPGINRQVNRAKPTYGINQDELIKLFDNAADGFQVTGNPGGRLVMSYQDCCDSCIGLQSLAHRFRVGWFAPVEAETLHLSTVGLSDIGKALTEETARNS